VPESKVGESVAVVRVRPERVATFEDIESEKLVVVAVAVFESVTLTVIACVPAVVGVPVIAPPELKLKPAGSVPLATSKVLDPLPPALRMFKVVNATPTDPLKPKVGVVMLNAPDIVNATTFDVAVAVDPLRVLVTTTR
jgi:hypothetical protein